MKSSSINITMLCSGLDITTYVDQTGAFYVAPMKYLIENFPDRVDPNFPPSPFPSTLPGSPPPKANVWDHRWPSHLVFFGALLDDIKDGWKIRNHLRELGYSEMWSVGNGFEEDWRRRGGIKVWKWQKSMS